jgi:hypothetical protein
MGSLNGLVEATTWPFANHAKTPGVTNLSLDKKTVPADHEDLASW